MTKAFSFTEASLESLEGTKSPWCELFYKFKEINVLNYPDSPIVCSNRFCDSVYKTSKSLLKNKESNDAGHLLLASLEILTKDRNEICERKAIQDHGKGNLSL